MIQPEDILRDRFGYNGFRTGQRELVEAAAAGRDCLGVMPTGAGKSLCYQVPALMLPGVTLVISPLVSLMQDQVGALVNLGIPAAFLNSQLNYAERREVMELAQDGAFKLLYVAPERLSDQEFASFAHAARIPLVAIDEAHCVSQWGQDFRPSYLGIAEFIASLQSRPAVAAFTATATPRVAADVTRLLGLRDPMVVTTGFDRPNLRFEVEQIAEKRKPERIERFLAERPGDSGIIYCATRRQVDELCDRLVLGGLNARGYHAGMTPATRRANQQAFVRDDVPIMVATNAFGMGIDKSNVRFVVHYNMPGSLEAYYQEAGRAGRDGEPAECLLLWNDSDIGLCRFFIEQDSSNEALTPDEAEVVRAGQRRRLAQMAGYCMTADCLRATILRYFGDAAVGAAAGVGTSVAGGQGSAPASAPHCGNCTNCNDAPDLVDVTVTARSVMRCVHELRGRFGKGTVADVLCGSKAAKLREWGLDRARTYDIVADPPAQVKEIIELLTVGEYLEISEGRYPIVGLGPRAREAATDEFRLYMKRKPKKQPKSRSAAAQAGAATRPKAANLETDEQRELFERLRQLRKRLADEEGVPPYVVFSDAALRGMCTLMPSTGDEFLQVNGVGPAKLARYGETFLTEINAPRMCHLSDD